MKNCNAAVLESMDIDMKKIEKPYNKIKKRLNKESVQGLAEMSLGLDEPEDFSTRDGVYAKTCIGIASDVYKYFILPMMLYYSIMIIAKVPFVIFNGVAAGRDIAPDRRIALKSQFDDFPLLTSIFMLWGIIVYAVGTIRYMTIWRSKLFVNSYTMSKPCALLLDSLFIGLIVLWGLASSVVNSGYSFVIDLLVFVAMHIFQLIVGVIYKCINTNKNNDLSFSSFTGSRFHVGFSITHCITAIILCSIFIVIMPQSLESLSNSA
ncbi:hypothetical protein NEPAR06_2222 [Nematocida parisii]|nr:hypothetical protein NEPAR03_2245 [Nematocida parisii]KAI5156619.1 hypothetical protein NEPAR06_2222 [Nematocida parisii]